MSVEPGELRAVAPLLSDLSDAELAAWAAVAEERIVEPGEPVVDWGESATHFLLLLDGEAQAILRADEREELSTIHVGPTWMGAIPILTEEPWGIAARAIGRCRLAAVPTPEFRRLIFEQPGVLRTIMRTFRPTYQRLEQFHAQREKLASLGTMSAGLAHELNNPAAAARRSADELAEALDILGNSIGRFVESGIERAEAQQLVALQRAAVARVAEADGEADGDALARTDREDALAEWLEPRGVAESWRLAEPLAAARVDQAWLEQVERLAGPAASGVVRWVASTLTAHALADELRSSTERISRLVGAIKAYTYMDQGAVQEVDVRDGLESTLTILGHKLKHTAIAVERDYGDEVPRLCVYGSELNQVWTNLLDNAIDALGESGTISIRTRGHGSGGASIEIADDGRGIPPDVLGRIYDPFFTTKAVGEGTGLGLETVRRIVVDRHGGDIGVESRPGETRFTVRLLAKPPSEP